MVLGNDLLRHVFDNVSNLINQLPVHGLAFASQQITVDREPYLLWAY